MGKLPCFYQLAACSVGVNNGIFELYKVNVPAQTQGGGGGGGMVTHDWCITDNYMGSHLLLIY